MNQVGGDKDFLDEVLADLLTESQTAQEEIGSLHSLLNQRWSHKCHSDLHEGEGFRRYASYDLIRTVYTVDIQTLRFFDSIRN